MTMRSSFRLIDRPPGIVCTIDSILAVQSSTIRYARLSLNSDELHVSAVHLKSEFIHLILIPTKKHNVLQKGTSAMISKAMSFIFVRDPVYLLLYQSLILDMNSYVFLQFCTKGTHA